MFLAILLFLASPASASSSTATYVVVPAADVWSKIPLNTATFLDADRETQVLSGEDVLIHETQGDWVKIEVVDQPEFSHHNFWEGYPGWVHKSALATPGGEHHAATDKTGDAKSPPANLREQILAEAKRFMGTSYLWGGLTTEKISPQPPATLKIRYGVDCSGLVHMAYRSVGIEVPRDSHEQWMKASPVSPKNLLPADLIFSAKKEKPKKIVHVAIYTGSGELLEAPQTGMQVRSISFKDKFGVSMEQVRSGQVIGDRVVYFGRLLKN